jgi:2-iminobutanoate/2-iminopropanoate deaminase
MGVAPIETPSVGALGPYSPAVRAGDWIFCSGQIGVDASGEVVPGGLEAQTRQALANTTAVLADCGCTWADVAKATLFVGVESTQGMQAVNAVYEETIGSHRPARSTVGVSWLPKGTVFEIEVLVYSPVAP